MFLFPGESRHTLEDSLFEKERMIKMHSTELFLRQQADTAREERRKENMSEARREINIYLEQGMDRNIAVNFVLDDNKIPILLKKEVRQFFRYGCYTICCMAGVHYDINRENSSNLILEAI
jgi:hypothetical protein